MLKRRRGTPIVVASWLVVANLGACTPQQKPVPQVETTESDGPSDATPPPPRSVIPPPPPPRSRGLLTLPKISETNPAWGTHADAQGTFGVVTSVDASATRAGVEILEKGGNAIDAAVATAFALAVTHPSAGNIGGGGFLLLKLGAIVEGIDFREDSPSSLTDDKFWAMIKAGGRGPASVGVPGTVAGLALAHERHGKLPWAQVVEPALQLAKNGYPIGSRQVKTIGWAATALQKDPVARTALFPKGRRPKTGETIKRPRLALALERIARAGKKGFYEGPTARDIVDTLGKEGLVSLQDLQTYQARVRDPLFFDFGEYRLLTMPSPSAGGVALTQALLMLQEEKVHQTKPRSAERFHLLAEASRRAQAERQLFVVAPESLSTEGKAAQRKRALDPNTWLDPHPIDRKKATHSKDLHPGYDKALAELPHTTHLSVVDAEGGLVSLTVTLSGSFGSQVFTKETGIALNNSTGSFSSVGINTPHPGRRTTSSMSPTLAIWGDRGALVLGSPGGNTIPSTVTQLVVHLAVDGLSLKDAVDLARIHQSFAPGDLFMEGNHPLPSALQKELRALGHTVTSKRTSIGDANIAALLGDEAYAVCDAREGGAALAAQRASSSALSNQNTPAAGPP